MVDFRPVSLDRALERPFGYQRLRVVQGPSPSRPQIVELAPAFVLKHGGVVPDVEEELRHSSQ